MDVYANPFFSDPCTERNTCLLFVCYLFRKINQLISTNNTITQIGLHQLNFVPLLNAKLPLKYVIIYNIN